MPRPRLASALAGVALCSVLAAGCGSGGPPSQSEARDNIQEQLVDQGVASAPAGEVADCITRGLFESGDFTKEERDDILQATDGTPPPAALVEKNNALVNGCGEEAGVDDLNPLLLESEASSDESSSSTTTTTEG
jgi:hypothetical protein